MFAVRAGNGVALAGAECAAAEAPPEEPAVLGAAPEGPATFERDAP